MKFIVNFLCILSLIFLMACCTKNTDNVHLVPVDFRDQFTGDYECMTTYFYFCPVGDSMAWCTDTLAFDDLLTICKSGDSSIMVFREGGTGNDYSFFGLYMGGNRFECMDCPGPPDYAEFFGTDSIIVFEKSGTTNNYYYYGKKQQAIH